jgi:hypothetical protein
LFWSPCCPLALMVPAAAAVPKNAEAENQRFRSPPRYYRGGAAAREIVETQSSTEKPPKLPFQAASPTKFPDSLLPLIVRELREFTNKVCSSYCEPERFQEFRRGARFAVCKEEFDTLHSIAQWRTRRSV